MHIFESVLSIGLFLLNITYSICDNTCNVCLTSANFASGTYRIIDSGKYCLDENIEFNPNPGSIDNPNDFGWFPTDTILYPASDTHIGGAYALGFFAAIAIETSNVELDLCQQTISQHLHHYIQQRFFSVIEINKAPFLEGVGPTHFGAISIIENINIHNGIIGLSSHHGIHANEANNVTLQNLVIRDFEVAGIQMNGFTGVEIRDITVGPSATNVQPAGYYSNAKFLALAYNKMINAMGSEVAQLTTVTFSGGRIKTVSEIYNDLIESMDIAFRHFIGQSTQTDLQNILYENAIALFSNPSSNTINFNGNNRGNIINNNNIKSPDGSALYGIVLHSRNLAVFGYGQFENLLGDGENVLIENVEINDLRMKLNEVPAVYFDECNNEFEFRTIVKGPFADVMDLRKMVGLENINVIDSGIIENIYNLTYIGNPLSDAQIALAIHGSEYHSEFNTNGQSITDSHFLMWALDGFEAGNYNQLPECAKFMCNGDIMLHTNKGLMGFRADFIENITIRNLNIDGLINESPLSSFACFNYTGSHDGGNPNQLDLEGTMGTDVKGIILYGSELLFDETILLRDLISNNGDVIGMHLMADSIVEFDELSTMNIQRLITGATVTNQILQQLQLLNKTPYPNNFYSCNILLDDRESINIIDGEGVFIDPNPPNGIAEILCVDGVTSTVRGRRNNQ